MFFYEHYGKKKTLPLKKLIEQFTDCLSASNILLILILSWYRHFIAGLPNAACKT